MKSSPAPRYVAPKKRRSVAKNLQALAHDLESILPTLLVLMEWDRKALLKQANKLKFRGKMGANFKHADFRAVFDGLPKRLVGLARKISPPKDSPKLRSPFDFWWSQIHPSKGGRPTGIKRERAFALWLAQSSNGKADFNKIAASIGVDDVTYARTLVRRERKKRATQR